MAYGTSNPPRVLCSGGIAGPSLWYYTDGDADGTVIGADYFSNGDALGMKVGDFLLSYDTGNDLGTTMTVSAVTAGGAATVVYATIG